MLAITFYAGGIKIEGHAFFAPKGDDIVCAAISGIVLGGLNWYDPKDINIQRVEKNNIFLFELKNSDYDKLVALQVMQTQIEAIAKVYPNYIKIINSSREIII
ncbi:ribosomal-processing cysteine protease Prp [[Mycoplasma] testudinis]|uniref:ribosomal-processing cysteine protease Prp n=1 Tax=[Mycoplasma] testudinis TaxID=33924 RepID=UPI000487AE19|nr:ribosomal-processing cysteine protease Prp [[Mycoplasma] testudinis]